MKPQSPALESTEAHFEAIRSRVDYLKGFFRDRVAQAMEEDLTDWAEEQLGEVRNLEKVQKHLKAVEDFVYLAESKLFGDGDPSHREPNGLRKVICFVTDGLLKMSALSLTNAVRSGVIDSGERLQITLESGEQFETSIDRVTGRLLERGKIAAFYRSESVEAFEDVYLKETSPKRWLLYSSRSREYQRDRDMIFKELDQALGPSSATAPHQHAPGAVPQQESDVTSKCRIEIRWREGAASQDSTVIKTKTPTDAWVQFVDTLVARHGIPLLIKLQGTRFSRRSPVVSEQPNRDYSYGDQGKIYAYHALPSRPGYFVLTHSTTDEKLEWILNLSRIVGLPPSSVRVEGFKA